MAAQGCERSTEGRARSVLPANSPQTAGSECGGVKEGVAESTYSANIPTKAFSQPEYMHAKKTVSRKYSATHTFQAVPAYRVCEDGSRNRLVARMEVLKAQGLFTIMLERFPNRKNCSRASQLATRTGERSEASFTLHALHTINVFTSCFLHFVLLQPNSWFHF